MENLGIDGKLLLAQVINFVLFFFIFKKFIAKPFIKFLTDEKNKEKEKEVLLNKLKSNDEEFELKEKTMKNKMKKENALILEQAKKDALELRKDILEQAKKDAEEIKIRGRKQLDEERTNLYTEVKNKIIDFSFAIVDKVLKNNLNEESKKRITEDIIANSKSVN